MQLIQSRNRIIGAAVAVLCVAPQFSWAGTVVATIDGCYDCVVYDTPTITIENTSGGAFTNGTLSATGYQVGTATYGLSQSVSISTIANGTNLQYTWLDGYPNVTSGDLFSYDVDDAFPNHPAGFTSPLCVQGPAYCSEVGNLSLTFTAKISGGAYNGQSAYAIFSPTTNLTGGFLGFEGIDPNGISETSYDQHNGSNMTVNGGLAQIILGTPPTSTPEPSTMLLLGAGLVGLAAAKRKLV